MFDDFFQEQHAAVRLSPNATATFHRVTFSNSRTAMTASAAGPALGLRTTLDDQAVLQRSAAWLQECTFINNTSPNPKPVSVEQDSRVYVSELFPAPGAVWDETNRRLALPWKLKVNVDPERTADLAEGSTVFDASAEGFITGREDWLKAIVQVCPPGAPPDPPAALPALRRLLWPPLPRPPCAHTAAAQTAVDLSPLGSWGRTESGCNRVYAVIHPARASRHHVWMMRVG